MRSKKNKVVVPLSSSTDDDEMKTLLGMPAEDQCRGWDGLNPVILSLIFTKIKLVEEMVRSACLVCKSWMEVVSGPDCWSEVDLGALCRRLRDSDAVDHVVKKVVRHNKFCVPELSTYLMGESGFFFTAKCFSYLKVLEMPMSDITDQMVLKHMQPLPNLTLLDVSHCLNITGKGLTAFGNQCKSLIHLKRNLPLHLCRFNIVDDSEAKSIANTMPYLQRLELYQGCFGDSGLSKIFTKCKRLTHLDIYGCLHVKLSGKLEERCERLQHFGNPWLVVIDM